MGYKTLVCLSGLAQAAVIENILLYLLCLWVSSAGLIVHPTSEKRGRRGEEEPGQSHVRQLLILSVARLNNITSDSS